VPGAFCLALFAVKIILGDTAKNTKLVASTILNKKDKKPPYYLPPKF
jgi:hypothetical protein